MRNLSENESLNLVTTSATATTAAGSAATASPRVSQKHVRFQPRLSTPIHVRNNSSLLMATVKTQKSKVRKIDSRPQIFAAEKQSGFMTYFEQETDSYAL